MGLLQARQLLLGHGLPLPELLLQDGTLIRVSIIRAC